MWLGRIGGHPPRPEVRGFPLTDIIAAIGHRAQRPQEPLYPPLEKGGFSKRAPLINVMPIWQHHHPLAFHAKPVKRDRVLTIH